MSEIYTADSDIRAADLADAYARSFRDARLGANGNTDCNASRLLLLNFYDAQSSKIERLRGIVKMGRDAYSSYGLLATPPGFVMYTNGGNALLTEWLSATDDYLHGLKA